MAKISFKHFIVSTFTQLSTPKRWLVRLSILGVVLGGGALAMGQAEDCSASGLRTGGGYLLGFAIGAIVYLPAGVSSSIGLASGVTQKPDWTDN